MNFLMTIFCGAFLFLSHACAQTPERSATLPKSPKDIPTFKAPAPMLAPIVHDVRQSGTCQAYRYEFVIQKTQDNIEKSFSRSTKVKANILYNDVLVYLPEDYLSLSGRMRVASIKVACNADGIFLVRMFINTKPSENSFEVRDIILLKGTVEYQDGNRISAEDLANLIG